jgi:hypothetical protein
MLVQKKNGSYGDSQKYRKPFFLNLSMHILPDNAMNKYTTKWLLLLDNPNYVFNYISLIQQRTDNFNQNLLYFYHENEKTFIWKFFCVCILLIPILPVFLYYHFKNNLCTPGIKYHFLSTFVEISVKCE